MKKRKVQHDQHTDQHQHVHELGDEHDQRQRSGGNNPSENVELGSDISQPNSNQTQTLFSPNLISNNPSNLILTPSNIALKSTTKLKTNDQNILSKDPSNITSDISSNISNISLNITPSTVPNVTPNISSTGMNLTPNVSSNITSNTASNVSNLTPSENRRIVIISPGSFHLKIGFSNSAMLEVT